MQYRNSRSLIRSLSFAAGLIGVVAVSSLPGQAQTMQNPNSTQNTSPSQVEGQMAPYRSPARVQQPSTAPRVGQPSNTAPASTGTSATTNNQYLTDLLQQVSQVGSFNTLAQAVQAADLNGALRANGGRYTIFAPTDEAFAALPQGTVEKLLQPENKAILQQVLAYHVVPTTLTSSQLQTGGVDTLGGGIAVRVTPDRVIVNDGSVIRSDIQAANGVVHVVNRVLMPAELREQLNSL